MPGWENEPRDDHGRWSGGGIGGSAAQRHADATSAAVNAAGTQSLSEPVVLKKVVNPQAEAGRHYETNDGRFQVHSQSDEDAEPGEPSTVWDVYDMSKGGEGELSGTVDRLGEARDLIKTRRMR